MMAGLWGAKNSANRMRTADLGNALFNVEPVARRGSDFDRALLRRVVWPEARKDALQHDSYSCGYKGRYSVQMVYIADKKSLREVA